MKGTIIDGNEVLKILGEGNLEKLEYIYIALSVVEGLLNFQDVDIEKLIGS